MDPRDQVRERPSDLPEIAFCEEKNRLMGDYLRAIRELVALHSQQTLAVIDGDNDFARFDVLIHMANERKDLAKYGLIAHVDAHRCGDR